MKKYILTYFLATSLILAFGQSPEPEEYFILIKKAHDLYIAKDYKNSAFTYSAAFKILGWKGQPDHRYDAALSWAKAGFPDSALFNIERIIAKSGFTDYDRLAREPYFISLHSHDRWRSLMRELKEKKDKDEAGLNKPLLYLIDSMVAEDQKWRNLSSKIENSEIDTIKIEMAHRNMKLTDSLNYFALKDIFSKYGYPGYDMVGKRSSHNFWLLVQHADKHPEFQDSVLSKMKLMVDKKNSSALDYAYLLDRVKVNTKKLQVYGTQMFLNKDSTSYEPKPVIEPSKLNERRKSVGLPSIEEYTSVMNEKYFGTLKKK